MRLLKTLLALILGFVIGVVSTIGGIIGGGYYIVSHYTPNKVEEKIQDFSPSFSFPENIPQNLLDLTLLEIVEELVNISTNLDTISLNELQDRLGYQLPFKLKDGKDFSFLLAPVMNLPILSIPSNMNLVVDSLTMDSLIMLGVLGEEDLPSLPIFSNSESRYMPIMELFSNLDSYKISDVISLYYDDYYPSSQGNYIMLSGEYIDYNPDQPSHSNKTRYREGYVLDTSGEFVRVDGEYIAYIQEDHNNYLRYTKDMIADFNGDKILDSGVFVLYDPFDSDHQEYPRFILPERSPEVLLAIGNAYINNVPDSDPYGLTISETVNTLQIKDIMEINSTILIALQDAYIGNSVPDSDPDGLTIADRVNTLQIKEVIDIYEEDIYEGSELIHPKSNNVLLSIKDAYIGNNPPEDGLTIDETINTLRIMDVMDVYEEDIYEEGILIHPKSNQVLISLRYAYIGNNPPEGGLTLNETINTLTVQEIMEIDDHYIYDADGQLIQDKSTDFLIAVKNAYIGNNPPEGESDLNDTINTLKISDILTIYNGSEYIISANGDWVADGFITYENDNPSHLGRIRFVYDNDSDTYLSDDNGDWVLNFVEFDPTLHEGRTRYAIAEESSKVLQSIRDAYLGDTAPEGEMTINETINTLVIGDIIDIYDRCIYDANGQLIQDKSTAFLIAMMNAYLSNPPEGESDLNDTINTLKISDVLTIYNGTEYIMSANGDWVADGFITYNDVEPSHLGRVRFIYDNDSDTYLSDDNGDWVLNFVEYDSSIHQGLARYNKADASSNIILALRNAYLGDTAPEGEMTLDETVKSLTLSNVLDIYDGYVFYIDSNGDYIQDGYTTYESGNPYHRYLDRYSYVDSEYILDVDGEWVMNIRPSEIGEEDVAPRYSLRGPSSRLILTLSDIPLDQIGDRLDTLELGEMIDITDSSPKIMQFFSSSTLINLEETVHMIQLKDILDVYYQDVYELDDMGYFVLDTDEYIAYDSMHHSDWDRYSRIIGISNDDKVYEYSQDGDYVLALGEPDEYHIYDDSNPLHNGLPRYNYINDKSSNLLIKLQDTYIYNNDEETLEGALNNLTVIDVLGQPEEGSLLEAISYNNPDAKEEPVLISDIEARTQKVMQDATLESLANWGIIDDIGFDEGKWDSVKDKTIQEFLDFVINSLL